MELVRLHRLLLVGADLKAHLLPGVSVGQHAQPTGVGSGGGSEHRDVVLAGAEAAGDDAPD